MNHLVRDDFNWITGRKACEETRHRSDHLCAGFSMEIEMNYDVGSKHHWRYWVWKRMAKYCGVHPRFATVLFLSGPSPLDLQCAEKNGFRRQNIVAVDMDEDAVLAARESGCVAIQGTLHEVCAKWTDGKIHGVVADYCCGLSLNTAIETYQICKLANAVACNFQRGRETCGEMKWLRDKLQEKNRGKLFISFSALMFKFNQQIMAMSDYDITEAAIQLSLWDDPIAKYKTPKELLQSRSELISESFEELTHGIDFAGHDFQKYRTFIADRTEALSYRSNSVVMDTVVGTFPIALPPSNFHKGLGNKSKIDGRLAALKAIRTMHGAVRMLAGQN